MATDVQVSEAITEMQSADERVEPRSRCNVVLTGFMGTGKTCVGREVAMRLGREFVDMDVLIEQQQGMSISDLFATRGEDYFRQQEQRLCQELAQRRGLVIATGGGALIDTANREALGTGNLLICLTCELDELVRRLSLSPNRPLLALLDRRQTIESLLAARRRAYDHIPHQLDTTGLTVQEASERVLELIRAATESILVRTPYGSYEVHVGRGLLARTGELATRQGLGGNAALVTNPVVASLYGQTLIQNLRRAGFRPKLVQLPDGEGCKTSSAVGLLYEQFVAAAMDRGSPVFALGGGVIGDTAGFAAATFMRGVPLVQLPTTLLAMVDSSVGGKVAINHPRGKNLIGAFYHPQLVLADTDVLASLPAREVRSGLAEMIKTGVVGSPALFQHLERSGGRPAPWAIGEAVRVKAAVVAQDPDERGRRAILNLGHTFGHALEILSGFSLRHGEAVAVGMALAAELAEQLGVCECEVKQRLIAVLKRFGLPTTFQGPAPEAVLAAMATDKKRRRGRLRFVLPQAIGQVTIADDVPEQVVLDVLERMREK